MAESGSTSSGVRDRVTSLLAELGVASPVLAVADLSAPLGVVRGVLGVFEMAFGSVSHGAPPRWRVGGRTSRPIP